jgi:phosphoglycolate phosphatase-like HAD superfamily hydrolase
MGDRKRWRTPDNWWWRDGEVAATKAAVFDLDGVLSDATKRQHLVHGSRRSWNLFFELCGDDDVVAEGKSLLDDVDESHRVVLLTARPSRVVEQTLGWLARHDLRWDLLIMRDHGDYSMAREYKEWSVDELRAYGFELVLAVEDDRRNLEMFEGAGIPSVYVHSGYFD